MSDLLFSCDIKFETTSVIKVSDNGGIEIGSLRIEADGVMSVAASLCVVSLVCVWLSQEV